LTNFIFLCACVLFLALQKLLYGPLRPIEIEQLYERAWLFVTETCLSMTIFRGSFGAWFMVMFFSLLAGKVWGWIGEGRVEILEQQPPANPRLFHTRLAVSLSLSVLFATYMLEFSIRTVLAQAKPDMMVMFGFEFAILSILATSTAARYAISLTEIYIVRKQKTARINELRTERIAATTASTTESRDTSSHRPALQPANVHIDEAEVEVEGWEGKGRWIFYLDLVTGEQLQQACVTPCADGFVDFLKLIVYVTFFSVLLGFYGLPLHIMRDLFLSFRSFFKRVADFVRYRNATRDMNARYPDATPEEVSREDVCIICREEMRPVVQTNDADGRPQRANPVVERMRPKKLPCGHILHFSCLRSWLERQQNCPTCRRPVLVTQRVRTEPADGRILGGDPAIGPGDAAQPGHLEGQAGRNRARIINFGPLRIGFGAGGGNLIDDLAQQIHNGEQRQPADQPPNPGGQQHFGFGFGFGRPRNQRQQGAAGAGPTGNIQTQLDQVERTLQQQISSLRVAASELHLVRMLNNELQRLRTVQGNNADAGALVPHRPPAGPASLPLLVDGQLPPIGPSQAPTILSSHQQQPLPSGSEALPEGVTLPPGWTLLPLQRQDGITAQGNLVTDSAATNTSTSAAPPLAPSRGLSPSHMFSGLPNPPLQTAPPPSTTSTVPPTPQTNGSSPLPHPSSLLNPHRQNSPARDTSLNETPSSTPPLASNTQNEGSQPLPSWGSAPTGDLSRSQEQTRGGPPVTNGESGSEHAAASAGSAELAAGDANAELPPEKGKGKAATVEDLVDDVD
jgi:E3 ubiquitin-protein ligase synoviolin